MRRNCPQPSSGAFEETRERKPALVGWLGLGRRTAWALVIGVSLGLRAVSSAFVWCWEQAPQCEGQSEPFQLAAAWALLSLQLDLPPGATRQDGDVFLLTCVRQPDLTEKCFLSESSSSSWSPALRNTGGDSSPHQPKQALAPSRDLGAERVCGPGSAPWRGCGPALALG